MPSVEIINRESTGVITIAPDPDAKTTSCVSKSQIQGEKVQVSYNSYGHIAVRFICSDGESDRLMVFDKAASDEIIRFIKKHVQSPCDHNHVDGIPF